MADLDLNALTQDWGTTDGWLSFHVPSRHGEIMYASNSNGQPAVEWSY